MSGKIIALTIGLAGVAVLVGFGMAMGLISITNAIWPFQPGDDDTLRERIPVALAYLTWAATALVVFVVGWRSLRRAR